jgi:predicted membrane-bound spermidine synthase
MKKIKLELILFICGAVVMIFEIVGSRVIAPYLGSSTFVWTSIIGIIMASLSLGYFLGGKIADKNPNFKTFSTIIFFSAVMIAISAIIKDQLLLLLVKHIHNLQLNTVLSSILLFAPASIFLGMVSPYAVRLKIDSISHSGQTVGNLYAISTMGSILGTFITGFLLIGLLGTSKILILLVFIQLLVTFLAFPWKLSTQKFIGLFVVLFGFSLFASAPAIFASNFYDIDTDYNRVWTYETIDTQTGRPIRALQTNPGQTEAAVFTDKDDDLVFDYTKFYRLGDHFNPEIKKALLIGGGGYSYPKDFLQKHPDAQLDVVEIDPGLTKIARDHFNLQDNENLHIFHEDGRTFVNRLENADYDVVYIDAFNSQFAIPSHLTTSEFIGKIKENLSPNGVILVNIISAIDGEAGMFLRSELQTYKEHFSFVEIIQIHDNRPATDVQNIQIIASQSAQENWQHSDNTEFQNYLNNIWTSEITGDYTILTDDFAPVELYCYKMVKTK